jgi:hypothetical protein
VEDAVSKVALVSRDDPSRAGRLAAVATALRAAGLTPVDCFYDEACEAEAEAVLRDCHAALVWVNPVQDGRSRGGLDALLRRVAAAGTLVSAHPDVIDRMGVKSVLARTGRLGWSGEAVFYAEPAQLLTGLPAALTTGPRVLKRNRGNGGAGVWKLDDLAEGMVRVTAAAGDRTPMTIPLQAFVEARLAEFEAADGFVDQAFQPRLGDGMIRCYMSGSRLVGFGWQKVRALLDAEPAPPRTYSGPADPRFRDLRAKMEREWVGELCRTLQLREPELPAIWDADFLFGPKNPDGADTYVLCEINASSVHPMPDEAPAEIAATVSARLASTGEAGIAQS